MNGINTGAKTWKKNIVKRRPAGMNNNAVIS